MNYTNKFNFPDFVVQWLEHNEYDYDENSISATTLMQPARMYVLNKKHKDELEMDLSDIIASRYGTAIHDSVEKVKLKNCIQEQRLKTPILDKNITGKFDILRRLENGEYELIDVKSTSVWSYIYGSKDEDYIKQLSIYKFLANKNGYKVIDKAKIWMVFTDWSQSKALSSEDYPKTRLVIKEITLWSDEKTLQYIADRIKLFNKVEKMKESKMPNCTDEELWAEPEKWAIMKEGRKSAVRVFETQEEAFTYSQDLDGGVYRIEHRKGKVKRCKYCNARKFCSQYKNLVKEERVDEL